MLPIYVLTCLSVTIATAYPTNKADCEDEFTIISREQWNARPPRDTQPLETPVAYVTIHHSAKPAPCYSVEECAQTMRILQHLHMDANNWWDIGYSFAVGSDGSAFEGRGWEHLGAHALHFNTISIGISVLGNWTHVSPPAVQIKAIQSLIDTGVQLGYIRPDYRLIGHRQVRDTPCPGEALFEEIKTWHHFSNFPASPKDLLDIPEIPESMKEQVNNVTAAIHSPITEWAL